MEDSSSSSFVTRQWEDLKDFWSQRIPYAPFIKRHKPLHPWSQSDVETFIAADPVHGPALKAAREAAKFGLVGSAIGGVHLAGIAWKHSKSPHGTVLALGAGAACGWVFGHEVANHWLQLYKMDTMAAQVKFLEWWQSKTE